MPQNGPDEHNKESEDSWEYIRENGDHLANWEKAVLRKWQVYLYKYKYTSSRLHNEGVDEKVPIQKQKKD